MKEWLRQHPDENTTGLDPTSSTSHQLRDALRKGGWSVRETDTRVLLLKPGTTDDTVAIDAVLGTTEDELGDREPEPEDTSFSLEYQLRDFLAQNLSAIDVGGRRLRQYVDPAGRDGIEYPSAVGPIDLLAVDEGGSFYVFELKRARSPDHAIGQLARYMGWVHTIGARNTVNGIIVAKQISDKLRYVQGRAPIPLRSHPAPVQFASRARRIARRYRTGH
jgi:endonuclease